MSIKESCTLPEEGNACRKLNCSSCGWDVTVLAARNKQIAEQGLTRCGSVECLVLPGKENGDVE